MRNKLLGAAALAAVIGATMPAHAARVGLGCSGPNLEKTETAIEGMADGDSKYTAEKEIAQAQDALLTGKFGACGAHLSKAMQATAVK